MSETCAHIHNCWVYFNGRNKEIVSNMCSEINLRTSLWVINTLHYGGKTPDIIMVQLCLFLCGKVQPRLTSPGIGLTQHMRPWVLSHVQLPHGQHQLPASGTSTSARGEPISKTSLLSLMHSLGRCAHKSSKDILFFPLYRPATSEHHFLLSLHHACWLLWRHWEDKAQLLWPKLPREVKLKYICMCGSPER